MKVSVCRIVQLTSRLFLFVFVSTLFLSCKKEEPFCVYQAPKDAVKAMNLPIDSQRSDLNLGAADIAVPFNQAPDGWEAQPLDGVRKGLWHANNAYGVVEVSLTAFPGDVGGDLANVNRWLGQIQLPALDAVGLQSVSTPLNVGEYEGRLVVLADDTQSDKAIIALILPVEGSTYFIKMMGPYAAVFEEKPIFEAFLNTFSFKANIDS